MPLPAILIAAPLFGALLTLSFAPFNFWPVGILSLFGFAACLHYSTASIRIAYLYGLGQFLGGASWVYASIHDHGDATPALASLLVLIFCAGLALFYVPLGALYRRLKAKTLYSNILLFPVLWVFTEWLRSWLATGFPWLYAGYAHIGSPLAGFIPVLGVYGASLIAALTASLALGLIVFPKQRTFLSLIIIGFWGSGFGLNTIEWTKPNSKPVTVGLVQPNFSLEEKWNPKNFRNVMRRLMQQTETLENANIVVWPESAIPARYQRSITWVEHIKQIADNKGYTLISGQPYRIEENDDVTILNSQWISNPNEAIQFYYKRHLVPFGEYVPFEDQLRGLIAFFDLPSSHFSSGEDQQAQLHINGIPVAMYICYEVAFPSLVAQNASDAEILFTVSNDVWFGRSIGPHQHFQIAATRALETGKPMVRSTNNGISGVINHKGKSVFQLESFEIKQGEYTLEGYQGSTPFSRFGEWLILSLLFSLIMPVIWCKFRAKK